MNSNVVRPPPPKKPGQVKVFRALFDFQSQREDQLDFSEGDLIYILDMISDKNWYKAKCNDKIGLVPSNYIEESTETVLNPMHEAAKRGNYDFLKECIDNKVSVNSLDKAGNTPLHWASYGGHIECVELLFHSQNLILNLQNKLGDTPLHNAAYKKRDEICKMLIERGARVDIINRDKKAPYDLTIDPRCKAMLDYKIDKEALLLLNSDYLDEQEDGNLSD